jgi:molybdopterin converting factor small subunit
MIIITIYQPVATALGYEKPGGLKLKYSSISRSNIHALLESNREYGAKLIELAKENPPKIYFTTAINGRVERSGLLASVMDGDEVSILPVYSGG